MFFIIPTQIIVNALFCSLQEELKEKIKIKNKIKNKIKSKPTLTKI
jgi:hypothetical protein